MILLITCFPWDSGQGGAFILRHWIRKLDAEPVYWFALSRPAGQVPFAPSHVQREFRSPPARGGVRLRLSRFWRWYQRRIWSEQMALLLARRITSLQPRVVWLMADFGLVPVVLRLLPRLKSQRLHFSIHDDLMATAQRERCSTAFLQEVRTFPAGLKGLNFTADAVTEELLADAAPTARASAIVTMPVDHTKCALSFQGPRLSGTLTIGFSGNFYGEAEFACFVEGLRMWSQRCGRDWRIRVFGVEGLGQLDGRIEARGFTPPDQVRAGLADCDLLLLPSPLDRSEMRTNMPTKLVSYLELGRMVFAFAPARSATQRLVQANMIGPVITELNATAVAEQLDNLKQWNLAAAETGWQRLLADRFNEQRILRDLSGLLAS